MPSPEVGSLEQLVGGLHATRPTRHSYQAKILLRSFLLERPTGNVVVYNSPGLTSTAMSIRGLGGPTRLLINHAHEAMYGDPDLDVPVFVGQDDRGDTARSMRVAGVFTHRQMIDDDLEVIPTPGHTPGTTSYLWDHDNHRFLFTGDFIWIEDGEWKAAVLDPSLRAAYLNSLALVRELGFDVLVPWGTSGEGPCYALVDEQQRHTHVDKIIARVGAGSDH